MVGDPGVTVGVNPSVRGRGCPVHVQKSGDCGRDRSSNLTPFVGGGLVGGNGSVPGCPYVRLVLGGQVPDGDPVGKLLGREIYGWIFF